MYFVFYKIYVSQFKQIIGKLISISLILLNDFMRAEFPFSKSHHGLVISSFNVYQGMSIYLKYTLYYKF